jgi:hypothetical protein
MNALINVTMNMMPGASAPRRALQAGCREDESGEIVNAGNAANPSDILQHDAYQLMKILMTLQPVAS